MGSTHIKALRHTAGVELAAVYSSDDHKLSGDLTAVHGNIGGPGEKLDFSSVRKYRTLEQALVDPDINAVDICLPTDLHETVAVGALRAGKHVLVEKPMALNAFAADRMIGAATRSRRVLMTAHVLRFQPPYSLLRQIVDGGQMGRVRYAEFRRRCAAPAWGGWMLDKNQSGGGAFDLLIHDTDMCLHLFGKPEAVSAVGITDAAAGIDCIDAQLFYPDLIATIHGGWYHQSAYPFSMGYTVSLEKGTLEYDSNDGAPKRYSPDLPVMELGGSATDGYSAELGYFIECCRQQREPDLCPATESAEAVKLMLLLLESRLRAGRRLLCNI
jgi:predicted dehydrogenase